ncbi:hypothetical protein [Nonomuraea sp. NPDC049750]|uniref:hypothetical protein n=1 Tax=Nonomuraea sp. NPDC049750 TaxID=3154738 RepID=UPI0033E445B9
MCVPAGRDGHPKTGSRQATHIRQADCPPGTTVPASDPAPSGPRLPGRSAPPADRRPYAHRARDLGRPIMSTVTDGRPVSVPARAFSPTSIGYELDLPAGVAAVPGPVCLTFHRHDPGMRWQENVVLLGTATAQGDDRLSVAIERALPDWRLPEDRRLRTRCFLRHGKQLRRRLQTEAARRAQRVPNVR